MTKITKREMFEAIVKGMETGEWAFDAETVVAFCEKEIDALDKKAAKAKERAAAKKAETDELYDIVAAALTDEYQVIADIFAKVAEIGVDTTVSKITYRLTKLVEAGVAEKTQVTIPGGEGVKSRKVNGYRLVVAD